MKYQSGCLLCGQELVYLPQAELMTCAYCGKTFESNAHCVQGHFVCDACHGAEADDLIEQYCLNTPLTDPVEMAVTLMRHPSVAMHGPEHHFLVPAVLLAAYYNLKPGEERAVKIAQARKRAEWIKGGFCGTCGDCGAGVGTGIFISLVTGATPLAKEEWRLSNRMTALSLLAIAEHGGPRCCKRDSFLALQTATEYVHQNFGLDLKINEPIQCTFSDMNKECLKADCPFFFPQ